MVYFIGASKMLQSKSLKTFAHSLGCSNNVISKNMPFSLLRTNLHRQYCSEKFKIVDESASVLTIRKTLKTAGVESTEGFSFIKTLCPVCDFGDKKPVSSIYINKVSGNDDEISFAIELHIFNIFLLFYA